MNKKKRVHVNDWDDLGACQKKGYRLFDKNEL